ncbi:putative HTH La-type RNA-binding protein [Tolypocladium ophioglossoides CBS 100239]|uniref:Putative HTH La-type RNA-binding protein n=1 Tax=Tolypocladium ophioglossoides (strain CBS 100239) TaxID=1163406 RepID=A0A0L0N8H1_TOLOC|nr:putative HTH La-type RNA-binding protein [Tolypocladium ophioglossoides CBS 100239]
MISAAESNSIEMAAPSTFSYAQAAKGQGASLATAAPPNPPAPAQGSQPAPSTTKTASPAEAAPDSSDTPHNAESHSSAVERHEVDSNIGSESDLRSEATTERRSESKRDDDAGRLDRPWRRADKGTRSSSTATRSVDEHESRKPRKSKKAKASDKQANDQTSGTDKDQEPAQEAPKIELAEAPIPSINIWQQRKEAQLAKAKPTTDTTDDMTNGVPGQVEDAKKAAKPVQDAASPARDSPATNGVKPPRKSGDVARPERNGSRGSRVADKEAKDGKTEVPPPVDDSASWPTPEIAIKEDKKKPVTALVERQDKESKDAQDDASQAKPRQKEKWVTYDYVPTVSFETQLPQMRNSKPRAGARGANGTRPATGASPADRLASATPASKPNESRERPRETSAASNRAASLPPAAKRASMDASSTKDQKKTPSHAAGEKAKDMASTHPTDQGHGARDRPEGRGERGRGGYRGRGGHHSIGSHSQHQHNTAGFASGPMPTRPQGPYSPPPRQGGHNQMFMPPPQRGGRGRNGAGANFHRMSLPNGASRLPSIQSQFGPYEYSMAPLSAVTFQPHPYWDNVILSLLKNQIEYYFSIENLCKDMYLRKRMDSQGFVNLHFVAAFKRIRELTLDRGMIRAVCESSTELDFVVGEDEIERLRRRTAWPSFVLPMDERDDFARNNGPSHLTFKNRPYNFGPQFNGIAPAPYGGSPPLGYNPQGEPQFQQFPDGHGMNGMAHDSGVGHGGASQLSAEVPDFSPSGSAVFGGPVSSSQDDAVNGHSDESTANALPNGIHTDGPEPVQP